jgi:hypothetical protein
MKIKYGTIFQIMVYGSMKFLENWTIIKNNMQNKIERIELLRKNQQEFSDGTFGTPEVRDCLGPLNHLKKEVSELIENPDDIVLLVQEHTRNIQPLKVNREQTMA